MIQQSVVVEDLGKCFKFYSNKWHKLRGLILGSRNHAQEIWALRHVNFSLSPGTTLAVIGANGSGKTTLLQLLAGLLKPTEGGIQVQGNLATLLELGSGFQEELTGRENVFISGGLRGFSRRDLEKKMSDIVSFAELQPFIDHPVKHYSAGMKMRLAFATAINVQPDVLLIDEVFAVGDLAFQHKCTKKFRELQKKGVSIVLVTHDLTAAKSFANAALLLDSGNQIQFGNPEDVTNRYIELIAQKIAREETPYIVSQGEEPAHAAIEFLKNLEHSEKMHRHGTGEGKICGIQILDANGLPAQVVPFGEEVTFRFFLEYYADVPVSGLGFYIRDRYGNDIVGINTFEEQRPLGPRKNGDRVVVDFKLPLHLRPGSYSVSPGFSYDAHEPGYLEWIDNAAFFEMDKPASGKEIYGFTYIPSQVTVRKLQ